MTRTEQFRSRGCRPAGADFLLCAVGACIAFAVQAADAPVAVAPPKPVVIQPAVAMAPPPPIPEATAAAAQPAAKAKSAKGSKQARPVKATARQQTVKPASKPKAQAKKR